MIKTLMTAVFGSRFDRERKRIQPTVEAIHAARGAAQGPVRGRAQGPDGELPGQRIAERTGALRPELEEVRAAKHACADPVERDRLEGRFHELETQYKKELAAGLDDLLPEAFATVREACRRLMGTHGDGDRARARLGHGAVRRAAHRRHRAPPRADRRDGHRRGQDARRHAAALPERADRPRRAPRHRQQLPGPPRLAVDGARLQVSRAHVACLDDTEPSSPDRRAAYLCRHHLRHQQRVRVRLPARQHGVLAGAAGPAGARLRHHRRGGLDPDRRGADAADHLGSGGQRGGRQVRPVQPPGGRAGAEADRGGEHPPGRRRSRCSRIRRRSDEAALKLYQAQLGMPKNKRLLKLLNETGVKQMVQRMELDAIGDRKLPIRQQRMRDLEDVLYFVLDEKGHSVHLTDRGAEAMSPGRSGTLPGAGHLRGDPPDRHGPRAVAARPDRGAAARSRRSTRSRARSSTSSTSCSRPTSSTRRKWTTWCRTARC